MNKQKNAFTLAEVMVTLAVIGVLASVMLPVVSKVRPNKQKALFKKAYYVAERMVYEMVNDEDLYPAKFGTVGFDNTDKVEYLGKEYGDNEDAGKQNQKFCQIFARKVNTKSEGEKDLHCDGDSAIFGVTPSFITTDGIAWYMPYTNFSKDNGNYPPQVIRVDVNGSTPPNCKYQESTGDDLQDAINGYSPCPNPDRFEIKVMADGKMFVEGTKEKEYLSSNDSMR